MATMSTLSTPICLFAGRDTKKNDFRQRYSVMVIVSMAWSV